MRAGGGLIAAARRTARLRKHAIVSHQLEYQILNLSLARGVEQTEMKSICTQSPVTHTLQEDVRA
eukprot:6195535-Pleurochrysis_carterae.AAC.2